MLKINLFLTIWFTWLYSCFLILISLLRSVWWIIIIDWLNEWGWHLSIFLFVCLFSFQCGYYQDIIHYSSSWKFWISSPLCTNCIYNLLFQKRCLLSCPGICWNILFLWQLFLKVYCSFPPYFSFAYSRERVDNLVQEGCSKCKVKHQTNNLPVSCFSFWP